MRTGLKELAFLLYNISSFGHRIVETHTYILTYSSLSVCKYRSSRLGGRGQREQVCMRKDNLQALNLAEGLHCKAPLDNKINKTGCLFTIQ